MTGTKSILDETYAFLGRHVIYPNDQSRIAHTLWILGSGFLGTDDIPVFDNYPILAYVWDVCMPFFADYLPEDSRDLINEDCGLPRIAAASRGTETAPATVERISTKSPAYLGGF
jgi:hypothetical protein